MVFKTFALCASLLFVQAVYSQTCGYSSGCGCGNSGLSNGIILSNNLASYGPAQGSSAFPVASAGPYSPNGISALSQNDISGQINVCGGLPFASAVAFESSLPTAGEASLNYGCGNSVGLTSAGYGNGAGIAQPAIIGAQQAYIGAQPAYIGAQPALIGANSYNSNLFNGCGCGCY